MKTIDILGPDGNAFVLMGYAKTISRQLDMESKEILDDMQSGDYEHLLNVFEEHFSDVVTLEGRD